MPACKVFRRPQAADKMGSCHFEKAARRFSQSGALLFQQSLFFCNASGTKAYLPGLKLSFRLTARLKTRCPGAESRLSAQK